MIDLSLLRGWGSTILALLFLVLWRWSEHKEGRALDIAAGSVETTRACVADYRTYADSIGASVKRLVPRSEPGVAL